MVSGSGQGKNHTAERTLVVLMELNGARRGAVLSGEQLRLSASRGVIQEDLDRARILWTRFRSRLQAGEPVTTEGQDFALLPVIHDTDLIGVVCMSRLDAGGCTRAERAKLLGVLARAIQQESVAGERPPLWAGLLGELPAKDFEREQLVYLLEHNEWNIARVARLMRVTRRTIYLRLERYGVQRQYIRKSESEG